MSVRMGKKCRYLVNPQRNEDSKLVPLLAEQIERVLGEYYIVGTTDDRTFCLLWIRVIRLPYLATYEPSKFQVRNPMCMQRARVLPT